MKLSQLKMFVAVADSGSFSAAAAQLDCTQSRISHAIAGLEQELGVRLLARSHAGSAPTDAGHRVLDKARQMLRLEASLLDTARDCGALAGACAHCLLPQCRHPPAAARAGGAGARISRASGSTSTTAARSATTVTQAVRDGRADIGIAQLPAGGDLVARPYLHDSYVLVVPASLGLDAPVAWRQLDALPFIALACSGAAAILARCRAAGFNAEAEPHAGERHQHCRHGRARHGLFDPAAAGRPSRRPTTCASSTCRCPRGANLPWSERPDTMRSPGAQVVTRFLRDRRILAKTKAYKAGVVSFD